MPIPVLQDAELDALTEVCNIGMAHAATALSQLMGKVVSIEVPRLLILDTRGLVQMLDARQVVVLHLQILGNVRGTIMILLPDEDAHRVLELLLGRCPAAGLPLSELEVSTLMEVANIVASACLNALGTMLGMSLLPSVPTLFKGEAESLLSRVVEPAANGETIVAIDTVFSIGGALCGGSILLIPESASLGPMLGALAAR